MNSWVLLPTEEKTSSYLLPRLYLSRRPVKITERHGWVNIIRATVTFDLQFVTSSAVALSSYLADKSSVVACHV